MIDVRKFYDHFLKFDIKLKKFKKISLNVSGRITSIR